MRVPKLITKFFNDESYRIFAIALFVSLLWHLLWLSTITIVSGPDGLKKGAFSKVSFLGPILGRGSMELQARPKEMSFLEKRYISAVNLLPQSGHPDGSYTMDSAEPAYSARHARSPEMEVMVEEALGSDKPEPGYIGE